jgi:uncharacterized protein
MGAIGQRLIDIELPPQRSAFLWGPRKVGKTYWLHHGLHRKAWVIDLLQTDVFAEYAARPHLLRERWRPERALTVIDEIQKVPALLDEVHWLMANKGASFLLTGSSARKLRRGHANLLGGRAWRYTMTPLSFLEVTGFELEAALASGMLPPHFLSPDPTRDLRSYVADYLKEEIVAEAATQNIPAFSEFLRVAALTSSELLNYTNVARETGVSAKVVHGYFQILEDTLLAVRIPPWQKARTRRLIQTEKFYLFDVGVANYLARRTPRPGNADFGKSFEHFILMELVAYRSYREPELEIRFLRTSTGVEVDFVLNDMVAVVEVKGSARVHDGDLRALRSVQREFAPRACLVVCTESESRRVEGGIEILPWQAFLERLWSGDVTRPR